MIVFICNPIYRVTMIFDTSIDMDHAEADNHDRLNETWVRTMAVVYERVYGCARFM